MTVDVIIPVYKPTQRLIELLNRLKKQTLAVNRIIVMNTEKSYYELPGFAERYQSLHADVEVHHITKEEFDHAGTRNEGVAYSTADIFVCMTHDAMPCDCHLLERLVTALEENEGTAVAYARQCADRDSSELERLTREFNYPSVSCVKGKEDLPALGIKTYFCSNVCAAYRKDIFEKLGGFHAPAIFNEDMVYAALAVSQGYRIVYAADAAVYHSHTYTCMQQFVRNFDNGVSQTMHPEIFRGISSGGEGMKMIRRLAEKILQLHKPWLLWSLLWQSGAKFAGFYLGKHYRSLPPFLVRRCTMNREFWKKSL